MLGFSVWSLQRIDVQLPAACSRSSVLSWTTTARCSLSPPIQGKSGGYFGPWYGPSGMSVNAPNTMELEPSSKEGKDPEARWGAAAPGAPGLAVGAVNSFFGLPCLAVFEPCSQHAAAQSGLGRGAAVCETPLEAELAVFSLHTLLIRSKLYELACKVVAAAIGGPVPSELLRRDAELHARAGQS